MFALPQHVKRFIVAITVSLCLLAGSVVAAPRDSRASASTPSLSTVLSITSKLLSALNTERLWNGLPPLRMRATLQHTAHNHNLWMARYNTMSHQLPPELSLGGRLTKNGYIWRACGENIAWNSDWSLTGALYLQRMMYNETAPNDGHRRNILSSTYRDIGIDVYMDATHHKMWITEDFGRWMGT
jgi:uncharacterized protein YkwD